MQTLRRIYMVAIKDNDHMTTMDENINWIELTHCYLIYVLNFGPLFVHPPFLQKYE
jgi:hypothetical protein